MPNLADYPSHHILQLVKKFIAIPSTQDNPEALHKILDLAKKELEGYFPMEEFESNGIPSLMVHNTDYRTKHFKIILNAHLDVVPGRSEQYHPVEKDGKLYGRGAYDMKAAAAVMILLFKEVARQVPYSLGLQLVTDEEPGSPHGTSYQLEKGIRGDFVITGEGGTNFFIKNESKGILYIKITTKGVAGHSAYPWLGENAVLKMQNVITILTEQFPSPKEPVWKTIATITNINTTNRVFNKVPDDCSVYVDIRYIKKDTDTIFETLRNMLPKDVTIEVLHRSPAAYTPSENQFIQLLKKNTKETLGRETTTAGAYASADIRLFNAVGCDGVEFGPLGANHHSDEDEWVDIESLEDYYHILKNFLLSVKG